MRCYTSVTLVLVIFLLRFLRLPWQNLFCRLNSPFQLRMWAIFLVSKPSVAAAIPTEAVPSQLRPYSQLHLEISHTLNCSLHHFRFDCTLPHSSSLFTLRQMTFFLNTQITQPPLTFLLFNHPISSSSLCLWNQCVAAEGLIISRKPSLLFLFLAAQQRSRQTHPSPSSCITVPQLPRVSSVQCRTKANLRHVTS